MNSKKAKTLRRKLVALRKSTNTPVGPRKTLKNHFEFGDSQFVSEVGEFLKPPRMVDGTVVNTDPIFRMYKALKKG